MSSFSLVFLYQCSLFRNLCIFWSKPHKYTMKFHVLIKQSSLDSDLLLASNELSVNKLVSSLDVAVDKSRIRKHWNDDEWMKYPPGCFLYTIPIPGLWIYYIYIHVFSNRGQSNHNLFLWYLWNLDPLHPLHPLHQWSQSTAKTGFSRFRRCLGDGNKAFCGRPQIFTSPGRYLDSAPLTANAHCVACPEKSVSRSRPCLS